MGLGVSSWSWSSELESGGVDFSWRSEGLFLQLKISLCYSAPLGSRSARLGRFPTGRAHPQGAVTRLCVKKLHKRSPPPLSNSNSELQLYSCSLWLILI